MKYNTDINIPVVIMNLIESLQDGGTENNHTTHRKQHGKYTFFQKILSLLVPEFSLS
jgi:hypothetical protein